MDHSGPPVSEARDTGTCWLLPCRTGGPWGQGWPWSRGWAGVAGAGPGCALGEASREEQPQRGRWGSAGPPGQDQGEPLQVP